MKTEKWDELGNKNARVGYLAAALGISFCLGLEALRHRLGEMIVT